MKRNDILINLVTILLSGILGGVGGALVLLYGKFIHMNMAEIPKQSAAQSTSAAKLSSAVAFNPPQPQEAPPDIKDAVMLGYNILMDTQKHAPQYVGNKMNCRNCHFDAGRTQNVLSLVGMGATYPKYKERHHYSVNLVMRTND